MSANNFITSESVRNKNFFDFPYFNLYLTEEYIVVVPLISRKLNNVVLGLSVLWIFSMLGGGAILGTVLFFGSWAYSFYIKKSRTNKLRTMTEDEVLKQPGFACHYDMVKFQSQRNRVAILLGGRKVIVKKDDAEDLKSFVKDFLKTR